MAACAGLVTVTCPQCGRDVHVPLHAHLEAEGTRMRLEIDQDAIHAHILSHDPHDGQPLTQAA